MNRPVLVADNATTDQVMAAFAATMPTLSNLLVTLAGPAHDGRPIEWPPLDLDDGSDESSAALLVQFLDLDRDGWNDAVNMVEELLDLRSAKRASKALVAALLERGTLSGDDVRGIFDQAAEVARNEPSAEL